MFAVVSGDGVSDSFIHSFIQSLRGASGRATLDFFGFLFES